MNAIPSKERIESFVSEVTGTLSASLRDYLEAHCRPRVVRQFTTVKPITTYSEEYEEAKIGDWVWIETIGRVCEVVSHSSQPGQMIGVRYFDALPDNPFEIREMRGLFYPGEYVTVVRGRVETADDETSETERSTDIQEKTRECEDRASAGVSNDDLHTVATAELVAMLKERPDVTVLNHPLREAQVKIAYFDPVRNERRMYATYGPSTIMVVQEGTA